MGSDRSGASLRGPGAHARVQLRRLTEVTAPAERAAAADALLASLRLRKDNPAELLDAETLDRVAREAVAIRNGALRAESPLPGGRRGAFLNRVLDEAVFVDWEQGIPASVTVAQAILESDWGRSAPGHNLFGMKGEGPAGSTRRRVIEWSGGRRRVRTANFRAYENEAQSLADHARVLGKRRYARARAVAGDTAAYARALTGVYATDPRYHTKLMRVTDSLGLRRYDWSVAPLAP
jgi:flagellum-specific peptidoglycan hydrolase FlgJ